MLRMICPQQACQEEDSECRASKKAPRIFSTQRLIRKGRASKRFTISYPWAKNEKKKNTHTHRHLSCEAEILLKTHICKIAVILLVVGFRKQPSCQREDDECQTSKRYPPHILSSGSLARSLNHSLTCRRSLDYARFSWVERSMSVQKRTGRRYAACAKKPFGKLKSTKCFR